MVKDEISMNDVSKMKKLIEDKLEQRQDVTDDEDHEDDDDNFIIDESDFNMDEDSDNGMDLSNLLEHLFTENKKNRNIVEVLLEIKRGFDVHNKIMKQMLMILHKKMP